MTVIRPNSVSGINSITAQADEIKVFKSNGTQGGLIIGGANLNATTGISTLLALNVTGNVSIAGTLTYQDVTNVDSLGIGTFRTGINVSGGQLDVGSNIKIGNAGVITATTFSGDGSNLTGIAADKIFEGNTKAEVIDTGSNGKFIVETEGVQRLEVNTEGKLLIDRTHASATTGNHPALDIDTYANGTAGATFATGIDFRVAGVHKKRLAITNGSGTGGGDWIFYRDNGNNIGMKIDSAGIITKPNTPAFFATINGSDNTTNIGGTIPFNVVKCNNGSHFYTSTYKFVAPVSGFYYFFVQIWAKNTTSNARFHYRFEDASNSYATDNITQNGFHANGVNNQDRAISAALVYHLDTGDRISVEADNTNLTYYTAGATDPHTYFCGYLIG